MGTAIDPKQIAKMAAETAAKKIAPQSVEKEAIVEQVAPSSTPGTKTSFFGKIGNFVKSVAPTALSLIPGVGPIAAKVATALTSENDDDWFEAFSGVGAAFNELLKYDVKTLDETPSATVKVLNGQASVAEVLTDCNGSNEVKNEVLPSLLAYVRKKTNNVLMEDPDVYWTAFVAIAKLHALYFTVRKYVELGKRIPVNIPALGNLMPAIQPKVYNQLVGMADALEAYLKTTTGLPYAYQAYERWRFGTIFHSDNTGKPGLIFYNYSLGGTGWTAKELYGNASDMIDEIATQIELLKKTIFNCGRAAADFHVAFDGNGAEYSVEVPHYDAKEFNLRVNLKVLNESEARATGNHRVVMDSRLEMNAALQAICISTANADNEPDLVPFPVFKITAFCYNPAESYLKSSATTLFDDCWTNHACRDVKDWIYFDATEYLNDFEAEYKTLSSTAYNTPIAPDSAATRSMISVFGKAMGRSMFVALQFHNIFRYHGYKVTFTDLSYSYVFDFYDAPLAYDTAYVAIQSLTSIHRTALRNLTRGEYSRKQEVKALKEDYQEAAKEMAKELLPTEINLRK